MNELTFNTTKKTVIYNYGNKKEYNNISTVKSLNGYYELIQEESDGKKYPILRIPINNTIMYIEK